MHKDNLMLPNAGTRLCKSQRTRAAFTAKALVAIIAAITIVFGWDCMLAYGDGGKAIESKGVSKASYSARESFSDYGTTPANISNGGFVAYAHGKTYFVNGTGTSIESCDDGFKNVKTIYNNVGQEDAWGHKTSNGHQLSCLHAVDNSLVFVERYNDGSGLHYYSVIQMNLDGSGHRAILEKLTPACRYGSPQWSFGTFMWLDHDYIYFFDKDSLWRQPLNGSDRERVADLGEREVCAVADGMAYYTADEGETVFSYNVNTGRKSKIFYREKAREMERQMTGRASSDPPVVESIIPEGDYVYFGVRPSSVRSGPMDGCIVETRDGTRGMYDFGGFCNSEEKTGLLAVLINNELPYFVHGSGFSGSSIGTIDVNASEAVKTLYSTGKGDSNDEDSMVACLNVANDRLYFYCWNKNREKFLCSTKLDGSDLRKDIGKDIG